MPARLFSILLVALIAACQPQGFFPDDDEDIPRDPVGPCAEDEPRGTCPEGETCAGGICVDDIASCSSENPSGPCADPAARCVGGACINDSTACSPERPDGDCPAGQECTDGACATDAPCAPDERFGFCDAGLACVDGACVDRDTICSQQNPGGVCPSGLSCHNGVCVPRDDVCGCQDGETCVDGVCRAPDELCGPQAPTGLCAGGAVCSAGACVDVGAGCSQQNPTGVCPVGSICRQGACAAVDGAALCDDDNACTTDTFDAARNRCENRPATDGASCDDGNSCTTDACDAGVCVGERIAACVEPPTLQPVTSPTNVGQLRISGTKPAGAAVSINDLTAVAESPDTTFGVTVNLSPGENVYRVKSVDQGASSGVRELRVVYDITPPVTRVTPEGGTFVAGVTATIASDEPTTVFFTTDGSEPTETSPRFTSLKQLRVFSSMTLKVRAKDLAGNLEEEIRTIEFNVTARGSGWLERGVLDEALARPGVAFFGSSVFVAGGTDGLAAQAGVFAYDVDAETWRTLPSLAGARAGLMLVPVFEDLYAIGGENAGTPLNRVERLRAGETAWTTLQPMPSTRHAASAVVHNNEIYVFGGLANGGAALTNVEVYSIADNTWRNDVAPMPRARAGFGTAVIDGDVYLVGGEGQAGALVSEVDVYRLATNQWRQAAALPTPRSFLAVGGLKNLGRVASGDRLIVAAGGRTANGQASATVEEYVVEDDEWRTRALLPVARHSFGFAVAEVAGDVDDVDAELWLVGGQAGTTLSTQMIGFQSPVDHARRLPDLPEARFLHGAAHLGDRVYLFGGRDFAEKTNAWAFDPETGR